MRIVGATSPPSTRPHTRKQSARTHMQNSPKRKPNLRDCNALSTRRARSPPPDGESPKNSQNTPPPSTPTAQPPEQQTPHGAPPTRRPRRSEEHTSAPQSLMRIS